MIQSPVDPLKPNALDWSQARIRLKIAFQNFSCFPNRENFAKRNSLHKEGDLSHRNALGYHNMAAIFIVLGH